MRKILFISTLLLSLTGSPIPLAAQRRANGPMARLGPDIRKAIQNGNPTEDERATLQRSLATLEEARAARQQGQPVDRQRVEGALADAQRVFESNSFRPADRQAAERDIQENTKPT
jgi:hypothetical protein